MNLHQSVNDWDKRGVVYRAPDSSPKTDAAFLRKILPNTQGKIYISSGEANYQVYSEIENELRETVDKNNTKIYFLTGPIINIPESNGTFIPQKKREDLNPIIRLMKEGKIKLYATEERQLDHYRIFKDMDIVSAFDRHELLETANNHWIYYKNKMELELRLEEFLDQIKDKKKVKSPLEHFVFLTDKEISKLKNWADKENLNTTNISLYICRHYWNEKILKERKT